MPDLTAYLMFPNPKVSLQLHVEADLLLALAHSAISIMCSQMVLLPIINVTQHAVSIHTTQLVVLAILIATIAMALPFPSAQNAQQPLLKS